MGLSRSRTLYVVVLAGLIGLSLYRVRQIDDLVARAFLPARALALLVAPFGWLRLPAVRAAEGEVALQAGPERDACRALLADEQDAARPAPELVRGRTLVPVRYVENVERDRDAIVVRCPGGARIEPGWPVVCGDVYIGRVRSVAPRSKSGARALDEAHVELVTGRQFRVGAAVERAGPGRADAARAATGAAAADAGIDSTGDTATGAAVADTAATGAVARAAAAADATSAPIELVVGGLVPSPLDDRLGLYLAAHVPSDPAVRTGRVRVHESDVADGSSALALAAGFVLGDLARYTVGGVDVLGVRAAIDYASGLHQMFVIAPEAAGDPARALAQDPFEEAGWLASELLPGGHPSFWRAGGKLAAGARAGILPGAAVAAGARWIGRVLAAGPFAADVGFTGDPGLVIHALARIEGEPRPVVLGALVGLGREDDGTALLRWDAVVPLEVARAGELAATLYTSSEGRSVPPGLSIGTTLLPRGRGPFVLRVATGARSTDVRHVRVWRPSAEPAGEAP